MRSVKNKDQWASSGYTVSAIQTKGTGNREGEFYSTRDRRLGGINADPELKHRSLRITLNLNQSFVSKDGQILVLNVHFCSFSTSKKDTIWLVREAQHTNDYSLYMVSNLPNIVSLLLDGFYNLL
jgi:phosphatidylinositol kinase/protein kinase (PI-3  family)